jgi:hypothetical protein
MRIYKYVLESKKVKPSRFALYFIINGDQRPLGLLLDLVQKRPKFSGIKISEGEIEEAEFFQLFPHQQAPCQKLAPGSSRYYKTPA